MSGFLDMLLSSGRTLMGDVIIRGSDSGIPYYEELIDDIESSPEALAATPIVESFGLMKLPYGDQHEGVQIWGIELESFNQVVDFKKTLVWSEPPPEVIELMDAIPEVALPRAIDQDPQLSPPNDQPPQVILGVELDNAAKVRNSDGGYSLTSPRWWMPLHAVDITLVPFSQRGRLEKPFNLRFQIANEFQSGVYQIDSRRAMIGLPTAQRMLNLEAQPIYDTDALDEGELIQIGESPARTQMILVRAADGYTPEQLSDAVRGIYERWTDKLAVEEHRTMQPPAPMFVGVKTWRQQLRDLIGPVEKERELMRILFSIVYLVCAGLVLSIFWSIVHEKTRDIGILRSVGASRPGILGIFLTYGLVIGLIGSAAGGVLGWLVVNNINTIHEAIGQPAPNWIIWTFFCIAASAVIGTIALCFQSSLLRILLASIGTLVLVAVTIALSNHGGFLMWDPSVYYFNEIPNRVDWFSAVLTMSGAIIFSVLGAAIPAARAADTDPVRALRYE